MYRKGRKRKFRCCLQRVSNLIFFNSKNRRNKKTGQTVGIKIIDLEESEEEIEDIQQEIHLQLQCKSPYVVQVYGSFVLGSKLWIIMEYLSGGSVLGLMKPGPLDEQCIAVILRETLEALAYLHAESKIHRDIKGGFVCEVRVDLG